MTNRLLAIADLRRLTDERQHYLALESCSPL
jgi:hypothetical protein